MNTKLTQISQRNAIDVSKVFLLKSDINYTHIIFNDGKKLVISYNLAKILTALPAHNFMRVSRQIVLNTDSIKSYFIHPNHDEILLTDGTKVTVSRRRREALRLGLKNLI